jgi:hypothetical protein
MCTRNITVSEMAFLSGALRINDLLNEIFEI